MPRPTVPPKIILPGVLVAGLGTPWDRAHPVHCSSLAVDRVGMPGSVLLGGERLRTPFDLTGEWVCVASDVGTD